MCSTPFSPLQSMFPESGIPTSYGPNCYSYCTGRVSVLAWRDLQLMSLVPGILLGKLFMLFWDMPGFFFLRVPGLPFLFFKITANLSILSLNSPMGGFGSTCTSCCCFHFNRSHPTLWEFWLCFPSCSQQMLICSCPLYRNHIESWSCWDILWNNLSFNCWSSNLPGNFNFILPNFSSRCPLNW